MLVHGYGENSHIWNVIVPLLPKKYRYLIPDLPGFGKQPAEKSASIQAYADYLNAILEKEKITEVILIGHSMGGYISMEFAKRYPQKLVALGLLHSHVFADSDEQKQTRKKAIAFIENNGAKKYLQDFVKNLFAASTAKKTIATHLKHVIDTPTAGLTNALKAMMGRSDTSEVLKGTTVPVLFVFGAADKLMPLEKMLSQCAMPDKCLVQVLNTSGHMGTLEEPEKCARVIKEFLKWSTP